MQSQHLNIQMGQLLDQTSNSKIKVENGHFIVSNLETGSVQRHQLPPLKFKDQKTTFGLPLKFVSKTTNVQLNPTGNILICKSLTFQQVDMSKTFNKEIAYWSLYLPQRCSSFSVGIKSLDLKKSYAFDFSINKPTLLTFKLDLQEKLFTCWLNGVKSEWHKPILIENDSEWTPFVRVKNIGTQLILNSLVSDPQKPVVSYINSHKLKTISEFSQPEIQTFPQEVQANEGNYHLQKITNDKIILIGEDHIKLISRSQSNQSFNFSFTQLAKDGKIIVPLSQKEFEIINNFSKNTHSYLLRLKLSKNKQNNGYILSGTSLEWREQLAQILRTLNSIKQASYQCVKGIEGYNFKNISLQQVDNVAQIFLFKAEMVNPLLSANEKISSPYSQFNTAFNNIEPLPFFDQIKTSFTVPRSIIINNYPFIKFNSHLLSIKTADEKYIACLLKDGNRVSIVNASSIPFKLIDTIISRGFTKETQINQYKKEVEDINESDFTKPHIFKILKNCLKYADKIKPPEKLIKELEKKKEEVEVKKSALKEQKPLTSSFEADKEILNSLISMGFNEKLSKKVLIQCKNQSIDAALELILTKYPHQNEQTTFKGETKNKPTRQWQCEICTLINSKDSLACTACDSPAPAESAFDQIQLLEEKIQKEEIKQQQGDKQISSLSIDNESIKDIFVWNTKVAYCPLLIAAVFETKIRFRLLGPNPKFYSNFYVKDNGYFDLTTLKYHEFAHQIDQSQINDMFFLSSSVQQQRKLNWGWMNIEDWDYDLTNNKIVSSIDFKSIKIINKSHKFLIHINTETTINELNCQIVFDNVYEERKRCFVVKDANISENQNKKRQSSTEGVLDKKETFIQTDEMIVSVNSVVVCDFVKKVQDSEQKSQILSTLNQDTTSLTEHIAPSKSDLLSLIAISGPYSSILNYPSCQLESFSSQAFNPEKQYKNGLVFRHVHNNKFIAKSVQIERQAPLCEDQRMGYFYITNDLTKAHFIKHEFSFKEKQSKTLVNLPVDTQQKGAYLVIVLNSSEKTPKPTITGFSVYGQTSLTPNNSSQDYMDVTKYIKDGLKIQFANTEENDKKQWKQLVNIKCQLINYPWDVLSLNSSQQQKVISTIFDKKINIPINIRLTVQPRIQQRSLTIKSIELDNFRKLTSSTKFASAQVECLTQQEYKNCLESFFVTNEGSYFDIICKDDNKQYRKIIEQIQLSQLVHKIIRSQYKCKEFAMLKQFINLFADELSKNQTFTNEQILKNAIECEQLTPAGAEILFQLIRLVKCVSLSTLEGLLQQHLRSIADKKPKSLLNSCKHVSQSYYKQQSIFSPLLHRLSTKQKDSSVSSILSEQSNLMYHFACQKHPHGRRYTIDMMSLYKVQEIELRIVDGSRDKQRCIIEVAYVRENDGQQIVVEKKFINEFIWSQIMKKSSSFGNSKSSKSSSQSQSTGLFFDYHSHPITSRYITISLTFTTIPSHTVLNQFNASSSSLEIIPVISGSYLGESQPILQQHFEFTNISSAYEKINLQMIKKVDNFVKYGYKLNQKLFYYTSCEFDVNAENRDKQISNITELRKCQQTPQNKQAIVNELLRSPSHNNLNYNYTMGYLLVNSLIDSVDHLLQQTCQKIDKFNNQNIIELLMELFINSQRGPLMEKSVLLLRKIILLDKQVIKKILSTKISFQHTFNLLFRQLEINQNQSFLDSISSLINTQSFTSNKYLAQNLSWLAKLYKFENNLIQNLVKTQLETGHLQQSAIIFTTYGWTNTTSSILNSLIQQNKTDRLQAIISASKDNNQLSQFAFEQLKSQNQTIFTMVMSQLAQKSRHTKINEIQNIVFYIIETIKTSQEDEYEKREQFLNLLAMVNKFGYTKRFAQEVIRIFFMLQEKSAYLNQLLNCTFMKEKHIIQTLLTVTMKELNTQSLKRDDLTLINDILGFVLSKQVNLENQQQQISFCLQQNTQKELLKFFSNYLNYALNIGGLQSVKMTDQLLTQKIKIAFYLSTLLQSHQIFSQIEEQLFGKLIKWLIVNITTSEQKHQKTPNCNRFLKIEQSVWKIIQQKGKSQHQLFAQLYTQSYNQLKQQISTILNDTLRYQCFRKLYVFSIQVLERFSNQKEFLEVLNLDNGFFAEVLEQFSKLEFKNMAIEAQIQFSEQQLVNELNLHPDQKLKPSDWLLYKNGSKNHVYKVQYLKNTQQLTELTFVHDDEFTLSKVIFAFKLESSSTQKNICLPKSITVEGGMSLDKLRYLGEMFQVKDERYYNLSTKLYGLNMNILKEKVSMEKQINKNLPIKCLKFKIRAPQPISIEDVLEGMSLLQLENKVSLVNFLSIQGYKLKYALPSINQLVRILELLTLPEHRTLINKLFTAQKITQKFESSLRNFSQLMKNQKFNKTIHNFLMRVCQQNFKIGNQMLVKYLDLQNAQICSKIATQIVLANDEEIKQRVQLMYAFIEKVVVSERKAINENILPFMNRFVQAAYYIMTRQNYTQQGSVTEIELTISQQIIEKLLLSLQNAQQSTQIISKFLTTTLTLNKPFIFSGFNLNDVLNKITQRKNTRFDKVLSALVINSDECRKWFMEHQMLEKLFNQAFKLIKEGKDVQKIVNNMSLLTTLSLNPSIKQLINKYQYNLKMFQLLMGKNTQPILSTSENEELRKSFVDLIARTSLGSENQAIIGQLLKDSIPSIISQGNEKFVGQIFLPLLNSFQKVPVCILPYVENENKLITDFSNVDFRTSRNQKPKLQSNQQNISGFRLPSQLVSEQIKHKLFDELKKNSYQNGKFNLALSHGNYTEGLGDGILNNVILSNRSFMMIIKVKLQKDPSQIRTICIFYNRTKENDMRLKLDWTKGSFLMFIDHPNKMNNNTQNITTLSKQPQKDGVFLNYSHYELNQHEYHGQDDEQYQMVDFFYDKKPFGLISYGKWNYHQFYFNELGVFADNQQKIWNIQNVQYWLLYSSLQSSNQKIVQVQQKSTLPELTKSLLQTNYDHTIFNSTHQASNTLNTLRYQTVYEFPASLTIRQLKQSMRIINCSIDEKKLKDLKLTIKGSQLSSTITDDMTLEEIKKSSKSKNIIVLDLNVHVDNLLDVLNLKSPYKRQEVDFLPRKGILKYFEQNQGIQAMIKVIKKSIEGWKNKAKMQKWLQYVIQLENFSHFPHFFAIYLKDKQTFNLLFNLLAGLPDKQTDPKWDALQASSSQKLLKIVSQILHMDKTPQFREYALKNNFFITILERLRILTGLFKRKYDKDFKQEQQQDNKSPKKAQIEDDGTKKIKKKKGVGYGNDSSSNTKWMKGDNMEERKKQFETVRTILGIIENFLDVKSSWRIPDILLANIYESALLPFIEDGLRAGTLLQISKHPEKFKAIFNIIRVLSGHQQLIPVLLPIDQRFQPKQIESIESLLKSLENISSIFLSCLTQNKTSQTAQQKMSAQLAILIKQTYKSVQQAIEQYKENHTSDDTQQKQLQGILEFPLDKKYRLLMKDLRFDYIDMKESPNKIKHHYASSFNPNYTPNQNKMIRLAQELADISTALPHEHTNAIYVRCDKDRVDFMQALIMGSNGTPYGHGAFLFDVYFDDNYPNNPPKVNLTTTGHGKVRFNPNLYACGKVCLSLLGTWRGSASENWDAKVSTLLQVLLSIQAIIMSEQIYFNEPGFENQQGTQEGEKKNEAYSNIVRYCNIKFAMIENIRNPPKGFETVIRRHFYLKKDQIMQECKKWQKYAQKRPANYIGLVNDHNHSWSNQFKKSKTQYKQMLDQAIKELQEELNKLSAPKITDIITAKQSKKQAKKKVTVNKIEQLQKQQQEEQIDVSYDKSLMSTESKQIDITDQKVKDRWSRYIGAMGIDAVSKQSKADILIFGLNPLALEVIKNLVLSGCRRLTICDDKLVTMEDLAGGFFYTLEDVGKKRVQSILYKIRELNAYVKIDTIPSFENLTPATLKTYSLVLATEISLNEQLKISSICRQQKIKFISADCIGFTGRIINDLGEKFEVLDKNGQQPVQVFVKEITIAQKGIVTLLDGVKNPFEDGEAVLIRNVQGMKIKEGEGQKSINDTIHKVKIINSKSFEIGSTLNYTPYIRNGTVKNIKTPVEISYKPFEEIVLNHKTTLVDENLAFYDFAKLQNSKLIKICYLTLQEFRRKNEKRYPEPWNLKDMNSFVDIFNTINEEKADEKTLRFVEKFALTSRGYLPPLCAFFGGLVCQQIIKAITQKFKPINSEFYIQFSEVVPELPTKFEESSLKEIFTFNKNSRDIGLEIVVGNQLLEVIKNSKLFMIGSGAIGCELLKNFAMIGFGTGQNGKITLTDPDHIENSNLNRQFLFREKHISKSKSRTASEAVKIMNPGLKNHITALTERVSDSTKDIFTNKFFEGLTLVANALDNVAARRYVDQRCVENKIPLFQSGTLGPKGHVQVIIPYLTESYGSQNDPVEQGEIPHCTLKMFPEETLHCVQWARDIFGKKFSLQPKALIKIIDKTYKPEKDDIKSLNQCVTMVKKGPKTFEDCINYSIHKFYKYYRDDVMQLLYTYPLDAKTKNGEPFWKLPKRPPTPIMQFDPQNILQCTFVTSLAVMIAKIYQVEYPKNFRSESQRLFIGKQASKIKIHEFVPSDEKAKQILKESSEKKQQNAEQQKIQEVIQQKDQNQLYKDIITTGGHQFKIKAQEFQKDDDSNGHIDFIYSMANLRAINYKLDQMDWINVKIKAGRIVPALATTTACVSGLQTLEICKYLKKVKIDSMRNSYLNLAVPSIQMSQPGQVLKKKITDKLTVNLWDRWEVTCEKSSTFGDLYEKLLKKYEIFPIGILQGMSRIDTGKSEQAKKQFMKQKILDKLDLEDNCIDLIVLFTKSSQDDKIIEGVPPIRLVFN